MNDRSRDKGYIIHLKSQEFLVVVIGQHILLGTLWRVRIFLVSHRMLFTPQNLATTSLTAEIGPV